MTESQSMYILQDPNLISENALSVSQLRTLLPDFELSSFYSSAMLMSELSREQGKRSIVYVESSPDGISPLNLCDAIRSGFPDVAVVLRNPGEHDDFYDRAMLAGAQAVVSAHSTAEDIAHIAERVVRTWIDDDSKTNATTLFADKQLELERELAEKGNIVCFMGGRGGAGRSTASSLTALTLARQGHRVALVDLDFQFGDLGFLFNMSETQGLLDYLQMARYSKSSSEESAQIIEDNLWLFANQPGAFSIEAVQYELKAALLNISHDFDIVICNLGAFWTAAHLELLDICGLVVCVTDQTVVGARTSLEFLQVLEKYSYPRSRCLCLINKHEVGGLSAHDIRSKLGLSKACVVSVGNPEFPVFQEAGKPSQVFSENPKIKEEYATLSEAILEGIGIPLVSSTSLAAELGAPEKKRWFQWV